MTAGENGPQTGFEALSVPPLEVLRGLEGAGSQAFNRYIAIHKVFVGQHGASQLVGLSSQLQDTDTPDHLVAAGWAATEAALILGRQDDVLGDQLLHIAGGAWLRAIAHQRWINAQDKHPLADHTVQFRSATDIAFLPIFHELIGGGVQNRTLRTVFGDVLNIAQLGGVMANLAVAEGRMDVAGVLRGFGYEINAILAYNRRRSGQWFALPASSRADSGVYHREQTHDIVVVHHRQGAIIDAVPIEMKGTASRRQRARYLSLLIRSKLHLSLPGQHHPEQILAAITADYEGNASVEELALVTKVSQTIYNMVGDYLRGQPHDNMSGVRSVTTFREKGRVIQRYSGLTVD